MKSATCSSPKQTIGTKLYENDFKPLVNTPCLQFIDISDQNNVFTTMVDSGATNSFVYNEDVQQLNTTTVGVPAMKVTLADGPYIDCSTAIPLYLKLYGNL